MGYPFFLFLMLLVVGGEDEVGATVGVEFDDDRFDIGDVGVVKSAGFEQKDCFIGKIGNYGA